MLMECKNGSINLVRGNGIVFRNMACAMCNNVTDADCLMLDVNVANPQCFTGETQGTQLGPVTDRFSFIITLSSLGNGQISVWTKQEVANITLNCPDGQVPVGLVCLTTQCPEGYTLTGGRCSNRQAQVSTLVNCSNPLKVVNTSDYIDLGNDTILLENGTKMVLVIDYDEFGQPIICDQTIVTSQINCSTALVALNESDYINFGNGSILFQGNLIEVSFYDRYDRVLICQDHLKFNFSTTTRFIPLLPGLRELTYIGCSLSVLGTFIVLVTHGLFRERLTLSGFVLINVSTTILVTSLLFIVGGSALERFPTRRLCESLAIVLHFFYLSHFFWMSVFSCEIFRSLYKTTKKLAIDSPKRIRQLLLLYTFIGWCLPLIVNLTSVLLNFTTKNFIHYGVDKNGELRCWSNHLESLLIAFLLPLLLSLSCNTVMFFLITILLCKALRNRAKLKQTTSKNVALFRIWLAVFSTTGITWIFGLVSIISGTDWAWYLFVIFTSTQGMAVCIAFLFTQRTLKSYWDLVTRKTKDRGSSTNETPLKHFSMSSKRKVKVSIGIDIK